MRSFVKSLSEFLIRYVAGKQELMRGVHARLTAPGIGIDAGSVSGETLRLMFQGLSPECWFFMSHKKNT